MCCNYYINMLKSAMGKKERTKEQMSHGRDGNFTEESKGNSRNQ